MAPADNALPKPPATPSCAPLWVMPLPALVSFQRLMQYEGQDVDLQRMCIDDDYAYECLVAGHCSSDDQLRRAAVGLFAAYHRNTTSPANMHWQ